MYASDWWNRGTPGVNRLSRVFPALPLLASGEDGQNRHDHAPKRFRQLDDGDTHHRCPLSDRFKCLATPQRMTQVG